MNSFANPNSISCNPSKHLTPLQLKVEDKLKETTHKITQDVISILIASKTMSIPSFLELHVTKKINDLTKCDRRTKRFSEKLLEVVDEDLNKIPTLSQSFDLLGEYVKDTQIRQKLITSIALPSIKNLINEFDAIKTSIVDDINNSHHKDNPIRKTGIVNFFKTRISNGLYNLFTIRKISLVTSTAVLILLGSYLYQNYLVINSIPYDLTAAQKIRSDVEGFLRTSYPATTYSDIQSIDKQMNCQTLTFTSDSEFHTPFNNTHLVDASSNFLGKIDYFINNHCCFHVNGKANRGQNSADVLMQFRLKSSCQIAQ